MKYNPIFNQYIQCKDTKQVFEYFQNSFANSITMWDYFVNWNKVLGNVHEVEIDLNTLNYLVGKPDAGEALAGLLASHPHLVRTIPILLASREKDFSILLSYLNGNLKHKDFSFEVKKKLTPEEISDICEFARKTGLLDLFEKKIIKSLPDYVLGVEVGLDSNGRKNRGGTTMENLVGEFATELCKTNGYDILPQANASEIERKWAKKIQVDKSSRRFDFAIRKGKEIYLIETNFYGGGGSKLKATAGEYKSLYDYLAKQGIRFIWITDGLGWKSTLRPLEEAFNHVDYVLNLKMMTRGLFAEIINKGL